MIQFTSITKLSDGGWQFSWAGTGAASYRLVLWGRELGTTTELVWVWRGTGYQTFPPPLEVVAAGEEALSETYRPYMVLQWYAEECRYYQVQQYTGGAWRTLTQLDEDGQFVYTYRTATLRDETVYQFRVLAVDDLGNESEPTEYEHYLVCPPVPPEVNVEYSGGLLTISE